MVISVCTCRRLLDAAGYMYNNGTLFGYFDFALALISID